MERPPHSLTGYGPRNAVFNGDERKYELWEAKFLGFMRIRGLYDVFKNLDNENEDDISENKNEEAYAELIQLLDDRSLSLVIRDANDDGRKALQILRKHYRPIGKARVITLYNELTSLSNYPGESITDYIIRAETASTSLKQGGEQISDSLLIAMVLKGLPKQYQPFITVTTQREKTQTFSEFKESLRNQEECVHRDSETSVHYVSTKRRPHVSTSKSLQQKAVQPTVQAASKFCSVCKTNTHNTQN